MTRAVTGFMTNSGLFFERYEDARKKDAEDRIREGCVERNVKADSLLNIIEAMADPILEYINAYQASQITYSKGDAPEDTSSTGGDTADDAPRSDDYEAVE